MDGRHPPVRLVDQHEGGAERAVDGPTLVRALLLLRADIARPILRERLEQGGAARVLDLPVYETKVAEALPPALLEALDAGEVHWVTFTSSSTAKNFVSLLGPDYREKLRDVRLASIGPITTQTLRELGLEPTIQADQFNIEGVVSALRGAPVK